MKTSLKTLLIGFLAFSAMAESDHMLTIDANDFNVGSTFTLNEDEMETGDPIDTNTLNFAINYARTITPSLQLRGLAKINLSTTEQGNSETDTQTLDFAIGPIYNVGPIADAFYIGLLFGLQHVSEDESGASTSDKSSLNQYAMIDFGKRFALGDLGPASFTFSPGISYKVLQYGGDLEEIDRKENKNTIAVHLLRLDVLW